MKSLKLNWNVLALVLGVTLAFSSLAFTEKSVSGSSLETGWFATDAQGNLLTNPYVPIANPEAVCEDGSDFCAKEYQTEDGIPVSATATPALMRPEQ